MARALLSARVHSGASFNKLCAEPRPPGCTPGCARSCVTAPWWPCSWPADRIKDMLEEQAQHAGYVDRDAAGKAYNEARAAIERTSHRALTEHPAELREPEPCCLVRTGCFRHGGVRSAASEIGGGILLSKGWRLQHSGRGAVGYQRSKVRGVCQKRPCQVQAAIWAHRR